MNIVKLPILVRLAGRNYLYMFKYIFLILELHYFNQLVKISFSMNKDEADIIMT